MNSPTGSSEHGSPQDVPRFPMARWFLCGPAGVAAYLLIIIIVLLIQSLSGRGDERDRSIELAANAIAAFCSSVVAIAVAPAYRSRIAILWVACVFLVACYGNLVAGFVNWTFSIQNIIVVATGCAFGCVAARAWLNQT